MRKIEHTDCLPLVNYAGIFCRVIRKEGWPGNERYRLRSLSGQMEYRDVPPQRFRVCEPCETLDIAVCNA